MKPDIQLKGLTQAPSSDVVVSSLLDSSFFFLSLFDLIKTPDIENTEILSNSANVQNGGNIAETEVIKELTLGYFKFEIASRFSK